MTRRTGTHSARQISSHHGTMLNPDGDGHGDAIVMYKQTSILLTNSFSLNARTVVPFWRPLLISYKKCRHCTTYMTGLGKSVTTSHRKRKNSYILTWQVCGSPWRHPTGSERTRTNLHDRFVEVRDDIPPEAKELVQTYTTGLGKSVTTSHRKRKNSYKLTRQVWGSPWRHPIGSGRTHT